MHEEAGQPVLRRTPAPCTVGDAADAKEERACGGEGTVSVREPGPHAVSPWGPFVLYNDHGKGWWARIRGEMAGGSLSSCMLLLVLRKPSYKAPYSRVPQDVGSSKPRTPVGKPPLSKASPGGLERSYALM